MGKFFFFILLTYYFYFFQQPSIIRFKLRTSFDKDKVEIKYQWIIWSLAYEDCHGFGNPIHDMSEGSYLFIGEIQ